MDKYEYKVISLNAERSGFFSSNFEPSNCEHELNILGKQGWDIVGNIPITEHHGKTYFILYTLRRKLEHI